jgi:hypothetical protein
MALNPIHTITIHSLDQSTSYSSVLYPTHSPKTTPGIAFLRVGCLGMSNVSLSLFKALSSPS